MILSIKHIYILEAEDLRLFSKVARATYLLTLLPSFDPSAIIIAFSGDQ